MRRARMKAPEGWERAYYHCVSRVVDRRMAFADEEKREFVRLMRFYARVSCVRVVAYCVMSNHFHVVVEVPARPAVLPTEAELVEHIRRCYGDRWAEGVRMTIQQYRDRGCDDLAQREMDGWFARMWDVSAYMKTLKQRFTQWFNKRHERKGTLWEDRYHSTIVQGNSGALAMVAAYVDLNPVRAGIVDDPKDYLWCSYAAALSGVRAAREGVETLLMYLNPTGKLRGMRALEAYRKILFDVGESRTSDASGTAVAPEVKSRRDIPQAQVEDVRAAGGKLSRWEMLRCRVRYFTSGAALGSREFVNEVFGARRDHFGSRRTDGARLMKGADFGGLYTLRDLQREVIRS